jgi:hypothetical protein
MDDELLEFRRQARRRAAVRVGVPGVLVALIGLGFLWYYRDFSNQATAVVDGREVTLTVGFDPRILAVGLLAIGAVLLLAAIAMLLSSVRR